MRCCPCGFAFLVSFTDLHSSFSSITWIHDRLHYLFLNWSKTPGCRNISDALHNVSRNPCSLYLLVHFWTKKKICLQPWLKAYLTSHLIYVWIFCKSTPSFKNLVADTMGQLPNSRYYRTQAIVRSCWLREH